MSSERYFMPYPASQLPEPDPADKLLCFELAGSLFSSWGDYWSDVSSDVCAADCCHL